VKERERAVLVEVGRHFRRKLERLEASKLRSAITEHIESFSELLGSGALAEDVRFIVIEVLSEPRTDSALSAFIEAIEGLLVAAEGQREAHARTGRKIFSAVSVSDEVSRADTKVTITMPADSWRELCDLAGIQKTGTVARPRSLLSVFTSKK